MKKRGSKLLALLLSLTMLLSMIPAMTLTASAANGSFSGGKGTEKNPYKISSRDDLKAIADAVNGGDTLAGVYFEQTNNIDLGGEADPWPVIGHVIGNTPHPFNG
ncbi:MAG: hypothetical protein J1E05_06000, partial [Eubacterium sp.]|nr:hypothetical protein [Eubacterium sp.]